MSVGPWAGFKVVMSFSILESISLLMEVFSRVSKKVNKKGCGEYATDENKQGTGVRPRFGLQAHSEKANSQLH